MIIARWSFTPRVGRGDDCISILRKWQIDVGQRIGWRPGSVRLVRGVVGVADSQIELEHPFETLSELEEAWTDMAQAPYHQEYLWQLETVTVPGSSQWTVYRDVDVVQN
jgi:hypothetical protein